MNLQADKTQRAVAEMEKKALESGKTTINALRQRHGLPALKNEVADKKIVPPCWASTGRGSMMSPGTGGRLNCEFAEGYQFKNMVQ